MTSYGESCRGAFWIFVLWSIEKGAWSGGVLGSGSEGLRCWGEFSVPCCKKL